MRVAEDAVELVRVGRLNGAHGRLQRRADILGRLPNLAPVGLRRNLKPVLLAPGGVAFIAAGLGQRGLGLFIEHVAHAFVEQEREDELLVIAGINRSAQEHGRAPEIGFELLLRDAGHCSFLCSHFHRFQAFAMHFSKALSVRRKLKLPSDTLSA